MDNSKKLLKTFQLSGELPTLQHHCDNSKTCKLILGRDRFCLLTFAALCISVALGLTCTVTHHASKKMFNK